MPKLFEMKQEREAALAKAEAIVTAAESANRQFTDGERADLDACNATVDALNPQIASIEKLNTLRSLAPKGQILTGDPGRTVRRAAAMKTFAAEYPDAFHAYITSGGKDVSAALYEGSNTAGGYAVPITVDDQIVPLAPQEFAIRQLATVIPTTNDIKFPTKTAFGTVAAKAESGASANTFAGTAPTIGQFTLSAFMAGVLNAISWELAQDVPAFQSFLIQDMLTDQQTYEEALFVSGTGSGQPQGIVGNVGAGVTEEPDTNGNLVTIAGTLDLTGTLNAQYHANATFVMTRATSIILRKAQVQSNLFEPAWTRVGGQDFLHGYPVKYVTAMPTAARGACPVLFGDFKAGYIIGDRGGSGVSVKVLDQPLAAQGQLQLLTYRRTDGRVRRSEAIQSYNVAAS
jgi:HK97 family phage major capsid protein